MASALENLKANYTDSEGEEGMEASEEDEINPGLAERLGRLASSTSPANNGTPASSTSAKSGHSQHSSPDRDGDRRKVSVIISASLASFTG